MVSKDFDFSVPIKLHLASYDFTSIYDPDLQWYINSHSASLRRISLAHSNAVVLNTVVTITTFGGTLMIDLKRALSGLDCGKTAEVPVTRGFFTKVRLTICRSD
jgi:hypothetical protein